MKYTDVQYLEAIRGNNEDGLRAIYRSFLPGIRRYVGKNGGSEDDAEDVFQDALVVIYRKSREPSFALTSKFYTLLYGVCTNIWRSKSQRKFRKDLSLSVEPEQGVPDGFHATIDAVERERVFWTAFARLDRSCQDVLKLFFRKTSMQAIARRLNLSSEGYAKKKKYMCTKKLTALVRQDSRYTELANT